MPVTAPEPIKTEPVKVPEPVKLSESLHGPIGSDDKKWTYNKESGFYEDRYFYAVSRYGINHVLDVARERWLVVQTKVISEVSQ